MEIEVTYSKPKYIHTGNFPKGKLKLTYDIYKEIRCYRCDKVLEKRVKIKKNASYWQSKKYLRE